MVQVRHRAFLKFDGGHIFLFESLVKLPSIFYLCMIGAPSLFGDEHGGRHQLHLYSIES